MLLQTPWLDLKGSTSKGERERGGGERRWGEGRREKDGGRGKGRREREKGRREMRTPQGLLVDTPYV